MNDIVNIRVAGLGGMGVLKATQVLGEIAFEAGYDVKKAEVHGMAQRGGSVASDVRFGKKVVSPMIPAGEVDFLLSFDPEWSDVHAVNLRKGAPLISPASFDAAKLKTQKSLNVAMLGALSKHLPFPLELWEKVLQNIFPQKLWEGNAHAFKVGRGEIA